MDYVTLDIKWPSIFKQTVDLWDTVSGPLAATLQTNRGMLFMHSGSHNGHAAWAPLRSRTGQPLLKRGSLSQSIAPMNDGVRPGKGPSSILRISTGIVTIGSSLAYAAMMNWGTTGLPGGVLKPKNAKALRFKIGRNVVFCKSVKIPERRFDTFTKADQAELQATLVNTIEELFRG